MNNRPDSGSAAYLRGLGVSPGIAVATAVLYRSRVMSTPTHTIGADDAESEWDRLDTAKAVTRRQLADLRERLGACSTSGEAGIIDDISRIVVNLGGSNLLLMYSIIVWGSVLFSAFVDNIPYVATMLPVVAKIAGTLGCTPYLLFFGLLTGATLGGNLTPIGASANIAGIGILRKAGYEVKSRDFFKIGIPFTLCAVMVGYLFCWIF